MAAGWRRQAAQAGYAFRTLRHQLPASTSRAAGEAAAFAGQHDLSFGRRSRQVADSVARQPAARVSLDLPTRGGAAGSKRAAGASCGKCGASRSGVAEAQLATGAAGDWLRPRLAGRPDRRTAPGGTADGRPDQDPAARDGRPRAELPRPRPWISTHVALTTIFPAGASESGLRLSLGMAASIWQATAGRGWTGPLLLALDRIPVAAGLDALRRSAAVLARPEAKAR